MMQYRLASNMTSSDMLAMQQHRECAAAATAALFRTRAECAAPPAPLPFEAAEPACLAAQLQAVQAELLQERQAHRALALRLGAAEVALQQHRQAFRALEAELAAEQAKLWKLRSAYRRAASPPASSAAAAISKHLTSRECVLEVVEQICRGSGGVPAGADGYDSSWGSSWAYDVGLAGPGGSEAEVQASHLGTFPPPRSAGSAALWPSSPSPASL